MLIIVFPVLRILPLGVHVLVGLQPTFIPVGPADYAMDLKYSVNHDLIILFLLDRDLRRA